MTWVINDSDRWRRKNRIMGQISHGIFFIIQRMTHKPNIIQFFFHIHKFPSFFATLLQAIPVAKKSNIHLLVHISYKKPPVDKNWPKMQNVGKEQKLITFSWLCLCPILSFYWLKSHNMLSFIVLLRCANK